MERVSFGPNYRRAQAFYHVLHPMGLFRYMRAPQGSSLSGDAYNRRFDEVTTDIERLQRIVDDCCLHDPVESLEEHWWRVNKFLETVATAGIVLNEEKFQFSQMSVDFGGFRVSENTVEPLPKFLDAIRNYPKPTNTTDIRSWFGLVNQASHYGQLNDTLEPFRKFLSPKTHSNGMTNWTLCSRHLSIR